jgi:hypothetical protein
MTAVIAIPAGNVRSDDNAVSNLKGRAFEVLYLAIATYCGDCANIFMPLNQRKFQFSVAVLGGKTLVGVFVRTADSRQLHFD